MKENLSDNDINKLNNIVSDINRDYDVEINYIIEQSTVKFCIYSTSINLKQEFKLSKYAVCFAIDLRPMIVDYVTDFLDNNREIINKNR